MNSPVLNHVIPHDNFLSMILTTTHTEPLALRPQVLCAVLISPMATILYKYEPLRSILETVGYVMTLGIDMLFHNLRIHVRISGSIIYTDIPTFKNHTSFL